MLAVPYLRPTVTQRLRAFLDDRPDRLPPWSTTEQLLDQLYESLYERRDDQRFWNDLAGLIDDLQTASRAEPALAAADAEVLSEPQVAGLLAELQDAVRQSGPPRPGVLGALLAGRNAGFVACITLLATSLGTGCSSQESVSPVPKHEVVAPSNDAGQQGSQADASPDNLVELFRDGSPDQIAARLEEFIDAGSEASKKPGPTTATTGTPKPKPKVYVPRPVVRYKGVTL